MKLKPQFRDIEVRELNEENRTVELSFSSEEPYERYWGIEVLDHSITSVNMDRLNNAAPLLFNHDRDVVIGVVEYAKIENRRGVALVRFGNSEKAKEVFSDVVDGIMKNVSVGYQINEMELTSKSDGVETYRVTNWQPFEISIVSVPADQSVGVGRSNELEEQEIKILKQKEEVRNMEDNKTVDLVQVQNQAKNDERSRVREISAIGAKHGLGDIATKAIEDGTTADQFRSMVLDTIGQKQTSINSRSGEIGLDEKEIQEYSFSKAMRAAITGDWSKAGFEKEASRAVEKLLGKDSRGFYMPHEVLKREMATTGSNLVGTNHMGSNFIEILRNKLIISKLGGQVLTGLSGNVAIPKQTGSATAYWILEGADTTASDLTIGMLNLSPKTVSGATAYTRQMLLQSNPSIENLVMTDLAANIALAIDRAAISGTGLSGQPTGILNTNGINAVDCTTAKGGLNWANVVSFETKVAAGNADVNNMHYIAGAAVTGLLKTTEKSTGSAKYLLEDNEVNGYGFTRTNQVGANTMLFGDFSQIITALWGGLDIMIDPYTKAASGGTVIRAFQSLDIGLRYAQSFSASTNINQ